MANGREFMFTSSASFNVFKTVRMDGRKETGTGKFSYPFRSYPFRKMSHFIVRKHIKRCRYGGGCTYNDKCDAVPVKGITTVCIGDSFEAPWGPVAEVEGV